MDTMAEHIIKGIIVLHSRNGITWTDIAKRYFECVGEEWPLKGMHETEIIEFLENLPCISSFMDENNEQIFYIKGKTFNEKTRGKIERARTRFSRNNNNNNNNIHLPQCSKNLIANQSGNSNGTNQSSFVSMNSNCQRNNYFNDDYMPEGKTSASLQNFDLLGDDFFLQMARTELKCMPSKRNGIERCGLCISGQTIAAATKRISNFSDTRNMSLIINIGSVDILNRRSYADMCNDYVKLVKTCEMRRINIVITTLAPLANFLHDRIYVNKLQNFNTFLFKKFAGEHHVVDLSRCMKCPIFNKVLFEYYKPKPYYVSGSVYPHLLWNRSGNQRVLNEIKQFLHI